MSGRSGPARIPFPDVPNPLTGVRFFLALGVVLFHYQLYWTLPAESAGLLNRARLGVDVLFILSGFNLTHVYLQGDRPLDYRRFLAARIARIYPAHLFILLAVAGPFILSLALLAKADVRTFMFHPVALFAGEASFALYPVHIPVLMVWRKAAQAFIGWPGDYRMVAAELTAMLVLTLAAAAAIHVVVERPGRRWLRARLAPQRADPMEARRSVHSDQGEPF